jgi:outer membrane protein
LRRSLQFVGGFIVSVSLTNAPGQQAPSPLTLQQAVMIALEKNPVHKTALAETRASSSEVRAASSFLLPHLSFSETATRGNDPVYVFGTELRQQRFTTADFALNKLKR